MKLRVRFRFNANTGEVEEMLVTDEAQGQVEANHDRRHEDKAVEVGQVVARHPLIREIPPGAEPQVEPPEPEPDPPETDKRRERQRQ